MTREASIEIRGLRELEQALLALQKEYGGKVGAQAMRPAVTAAIRPLEDRVIETTPVDQGALVGSVKRRVGAVTRDMRSYSSTMYKSSTILAGRVGYFGNHVYKRAISVEYGTVNMAAQHTLERAFDSEVRGMAKRFGDTLGKAIERKAKALHKKQMKG